MHYDFPGNIRELEHIIERALIFAENDLIDPDDLNLPIDIPKGAVKHKGITYQENEEIVSIEELEKMHIARALKINRWDRAQTANQLGISPKTLYTKIKKYAIKQE